jgi:hypothetical protein
MSRTRSIALNLSLSVAALSSVATAVLADSWIEIGFSAAVIVSILVVKILSAGEAPPS